MKGNIPLLAHKQQLSQTVCTNFRLLKKQPTIKSNSTDCAKPVKKSPVTAHGLRFSFGSNTNEERKGEKTVNPVMQKATPEDFDRTLHRAERKLNFPKKYEPKPRNDPLRYLQTWLHAQRLHAPRCNNSVCTQGIDALREPSFNRFYAHFPHGICSFIYFPERVPLELAMHPEAAKGSRQNTCFKKAPPQ